MIRVVLDTNILVSIALPGSRLLPLREAWLKRQCLLLVSDEIFEEYLRVLSYPRFQLSAEGIRRILEEDLWPYAEWVDVKTRVDVISADPSDNKFLACAVDGHAHWIVTGDHHLLALKKFRAIRIGKPTQFLQELRGPGSKSYT